MLKKAQWLSATGLDHDVSILFVSLFVDKAETQVRGLIVKLAMMIHRLHVLISLKEQLKEHMCIGNPSTHRNATLVTCMSLRGEHKQHTTKCFSLVFIATLAGCV